MKTRQIDGKDYVFCEWRRKFVRLTPEEWVRQTFLGRLVADYAFPPERIAVEVQMVGKRADAIVYDRGLRPLMLLEFKADTVALTQKTLDQAAVYNRQLHVPYLVLSNGRQTVVAKIDEKKIDFLETIPRWTQLSN